MLNFYILDKKYIIEITGVPGAGKSFLINKLNCLVECDDILIHTEKHTHSSFFDRITKVFIYLKYSHLILKEKYYRICFFYIKNIILHERDIKILIYRISLFLDTVIMYNKTISKDQKICIIDEGFVQRGYSLFLSTYSLETTIKYYSLLKDLYCLIILERSFETVQLNLLDREDSKNFATSEKYYKSFYNIFKQNNHTFHKLFLR